MHDPPVLLLDEPYQGFDWQTYLAFWDLAGELRVRGTAIVVISHLVFEHDRFDRICQLREGRIDSEVGDHRGSLRPRSASPWPRRSEPAGLDLLVASVPIWYLLIGAMITHGETTFKLRAIGAAVVVDSHHLTLITAGLNAITLITGFVVFAAVRRSLPFDRRLVLCGYRHGALIAAKTNAALLQAIGIGIYAAIVMLAFWRPAALWAIAAAFMLGAATYAAFGLLIGVLVRGDLEGFFLIIMISILDTFLENPVDNPLANKAILQFFSSYGPTQFAAAGAFHHQAPRAGGPAPAVAQGRPRGSAGQLAWARHPADPRRSRGHD